MLHNRSLQMEREPLAGDSLKKSKQFMQAVGQSEDTPSKPCNQAKTGPDRVRQERAKGRPKLTREREIELLDVEPQTGAIRHRVSRGGKRAGDIAGTLSHGYRVVFVDYWPYKASHLIWLYMTGELPPEGMVIDHINGVRDDDRWENLRLCTPAENARNRGKCARNKSGRVGVAVGPRPGTWQPHITFNGRTRSLGVFECLGDAVAERCRAEKHLFGKFARGAV